MLIGLDASRSNASRKTGTEYYSARVLEAIVASRHSHNYLLYTRQPAPTAYKTAVVRHLQPARLWTHVALGRELIRRPPDALFVPAHVLPVSMAVHKPTRVVITLHDAGFRYFPKAHTATQRLYLNWSTRFACRHADTVICDSSASREDFIRHFALPMRSAIVAHPGFEPTPSIAVDEIARIRARYGVSPDAPIVLSIGTLQPRKNYARLVEAFAHVIAAWEPSVKPILILAGGEGWGGIDHHAVVRKFGVEQSVRFTGYVDEGTKHALLRAATVFAFPSLYEGFGFPVLEAQSAGVPVMCSNTSSLPEVAGDAAHLIDPLDVGAMATGLRDMLQDEALRTRLMTRGTANLRRFNWNTCAKIILAALEGR